MPQIGVRELRAHASEIVRKVYDERARYVITRRGKLVGLLIPLVDAPADDSATDPWDQLFALGEEISKGWPQGIDSAELLSEMRR